MLNIMKKITIFTFAALAISACTSSGSNDWYYDDMKPKMESALRYMLTPDEISDEAAPEEYFETGDYDYAVENTVSAIYEYFDSRMIDYTALDEEKEQELVEYFVCRQPFYEDLTSKDEQKMVKKTVKTFCDYIAAEVAKTPVRTLSGLKYDRSEGKREYYLVSCLETGDVYEIWWSQTSDRIESFGYSLEPVSD